MVNEYRIFTDDGKPVFVVGRKQFTTNDNGRPAREFGAVTSKWSQLRLSLAQEQLGPVEWRLIGKTEMMGVYF